MYSKRISLHRYGRILGEERRRRGLSQRALGEIAGVTQGQISLIENGEVDPRLSTAIELGRALELELTLVPRQRLSAVRTIIGQRAREEAPSTIDQHWKKILGVLRRKLAEEPDRLDLARACSLIRDIERLDQDTRAGAGDRSALSSEAQLREYLGDEQGLGRLIERLEDWRNRIAHQALSQPYARAIRPAYSLDPDQDG